MKYVSIDTETLGLDPEHHDLIEFGAVLDDLAIQAPLEDLPRFHAYLLPPRREGYRGEPYAMSMHATLLRRIATREHDRVQVGDGGYRYLEPAQFVREFASWCRQHGLKKEPAKPKPGFHTVLAPSPTDIRFVPAGKNFAGFDQRFLRRLPGWSDLRISHRVMDPAMLYFDPSTDKAPPNLSECLKRAGVEQTEVAHTAVEDALSVIELIRAKFPMSSVHTNLPEEMRHCPPGAKDNGLPFFDIWSTGYHAQGEGQVGAIKHGRMDGADFKAACKRLAVIDEKFRSNFDPDRMTWWGCGLYEQEAAARVAFG